MRTPALSSRLGAEALGTFWLVFGGCGSAIFSAKYLTPNVVTGQAVQLGIGFLGVALAFGLTVLTMAYAVGHVSGAHFNPAVTIGVAVARRFPWRDVPAYLAAQVVGGLLAGLALWGIARGVSGFDATGNLAANGYGDHSPGGYSMGGAFLAETILTAFLIFTVLSATNRLANVAFAGIPIGLVLTLIHLVGIPITNTSVNPARSIGPAIFVGGWALSQLWLFIVAPLVGALLGAGVHMALFKDASAIEPEESAVASGPERSKQMA